MKASCDHTRPCARCSGDIREGEQIVVYATAGGDAGEGTTYWAHKTCPTTPISQDVGTA